MHLLEPCAKRTDLEFWEQRLRRLGVPYTVELVADGWTIEVPQDWNESHYVVSKPGPGRPRKQ